MDASASNRPPPIRRDPQSRWLDLVSQAERGPVPAAARAGLAVLAGLYRVGLAAANVRWRFPSAVHRAPCPVISVGNLTVGGTGKTPMVAYLAGMLVAEGYRPLIVSRGYGAEPGSPNEEAGELGRRCPDVPQVQFPDRLRAIQEWTAQHPCDVAILDDGFQHRRLDRDLDIVLLDALRPFGYGHVLPRGLLREPPSALARADMVVITRAALIEADALARLKAVVGRLVAAETPVLVADHRPAEVAFADGSCQPANWLCERPVAAVCAIANPEAFEQTLDSIGAQVVRFDAFRDHYAYTAADLARLGAGATAAGANVLVTTGKDFVKWRPLLTHDREAVPVPCAALEVAMHFTEGEAVLHDRVRRLMPPPPGRRGDP